MKKDFDDFSAQQVQKIAQSDTARQLMSRLQADHGDAIQAAQAGDYQQALQALLRDPQTARLLQQLQEEYHG